MKVSIYTDDGKRGFIQYHEVTKDLMVTHPDKETRQYIRAYLKTPTEFTVPFPNSRQTGYVTATPTDSENYLQRALSSMYSHIDVHVDWSHPENELTHVKTPEAEGMQQPVDKIEDKPLQEQTIRPNMAKSIDGDDIYEIVN